MIDQGMSDLSQHNPLEETAPRDELTFPSVYLANSTEDQRSEIVLTGFSLSLS